MTLVFLLLASMLPGVFAGGLDFGPAFQNFRLTLEPGERMEAAGPFFYSEQAGERERWAFPPLWARETDSGIDSTEFDLSYPLLTYDRFGADYRFQILQLFSFSGGESLTATNKHRISLFPIYLQQRSADPNLNYTSVLPFYGTLKNRFFRDEVHYVMMPLYVHSKKRDVITNNFLYPVFHVRRGQGLKGWQAWPLVGHETKTALAYTNNWGDTEINPGHEKWFALWPLFLDQRSGIGGTNAEHQQASIPLYSFTRSPLRDSTSVPFALGVTYTVDRGKRYREIGAPWPLIVFRRGETANTSRVWPFYSHATNEFLESTWYLWPVYKYNRVHSDPLDRERTRILLFLYSDIHDRNTESGTAVRRRDCWPLFTHRRDRDGNERLQVLALIEPVLPNNKSIERSYSPLWSLWRSEKNAQTGASSQSLLWNLYRRERAPERSRTSALFGLFQREKSGGRSRWRVFYIPFGKRPEAESPAVPTSPPAAAE